MTTSAIMNMPHERPNPARDAGLQCLLAIAALHGIAIDAEQVLHEFATPGEPLGVDALILAARSKGLHAKRVRTDCGRLATTPLPAIGIDREGGFFVLAAANEASALIHAFPSERPEKLGHEELAQRWAGELLLFTSRASLIGELRKFDFTWFVPAIVKYRKMLGEVVAVSFILQLFALATPLFFQAVMDKVLLHRAMTTLDVIAIGLACVVLFEVVLSGLRTYVFAHTTSRIDVELGARLFRHLLALPLAYFEARRVGDSVARIRELENIRAFLTSNSVTLLIDICFTVVFLAVMYYYSPLLATIVLLSLPCYALLVGTLTPPLRARLHEKFNRGATNQAFLVETVSAIGTVKAMAVEPHWTREWEKQLAGYVAAAFRTTVVGTFASSGVSLIGKAVTVLTLYFGAKAVMNGELSVGQLIAFNMLAGNVAAPIMRLASLWPEFQQMAVSMQRLGDILNAHTEVAGSRSPLPPLAGRIEFDKVRFRYGPGTPEVMRGVSLRVEAGEFIGIVGHSGSGKSTLAKLVQRLYVPESGRVLVDGIDLSVVDTASLRRQIGVVQQENLLFNRTIRENIALTDPAASLEKIIAAARLAGAHDFISELPESYDTLVGEHGSTLSGGQRQRIAIARALMHDPKILIFDEATSALDYESERVIQENMRHIARNRTVIVIAHRLSAVRDASRIVVVERGEIVESGSHDELLGIADGYYARLFNSQGG